MKRIIVPLAVGFFAVRAFAGSTEAHGVWSTEKNSEGGYLEVTIAPCANDDTLTCGTITKAYNRTGQDPAYANLGKSIVAGMKHDGSGAYSGGTIWDPENGKTYSSKMTLKGNELDVDGCISFFCQGQHWKRVGP